MTTNSFGETFSLNPTNQYKINNSLDTNTKQEITHAIIIN